MSLCGTNDDEQLKIELLSQWKLEAEFRKTHNHILPFRRSLFFCTFLLTNANGAAFQRIAESLDCNCNFVTNIGLGSLKSVRMISIFSQTRQYKYGGWDDALVQFGQTPCACWLDGWLPPADRWHWHWHWHWHWLHWWRRYIDRGKERSKWAN